MTAGPARGLTALIGDSLVIPECVSSSHMSERLISAALLTLRSLLSAFGRRMGVDRVSAQGRSQASASLISAAESGRIKGNRSCRALVAHFAIATFSQPWQASGSMRYRSSPSLRFTEAPRLSISESSSWKSETTSSGQEFRSTNEQDNRTEFCTEGCPSSWQRL